MRSLILLAVFTLSCSSVPRTKGYYNLTGPVETTHDRVRDEQRHLKNQTDKLDAAQILKNLDERYSWSDCYRVSNMSSQWGLIEPEAIFETEAVFNAGHKALVVVPPLLDERKEFRTPQEAEKIAVFRLDQDAPHSTHLIREMNRIIGNREYCVQLSYVDDPKSDAHHAITGGRIMLATRAKAPKKTIPEIAKEPPKNRIQ